jgi:hypothetical protein
VEAFDLPVEAKGKALLVWNVAGAAPVYEEIVEYHAGKPPEGRQAPRPTLHCGDRVVEALAVDFPFQDPPKSISMPKGSPIASRRHLGIVSGLDRPASTWCGDMLLSEGRTAEALRILEARGACGGWKVAEAIVALRLAVAIGPADGERVARAVRAALPGDLLVERSYQNALEGAGKGDEVLAEYRGRAEAAPDSATAQYLYVRLLDGAAQRDRAEAALSRFPRDPDLLRLVTALRAEAGEHAAAVESYRALRALSPEQAAQVLQEAVTSLVALGRRDEARSEAAALFEALPPPQRDEPAALFARVAALDRDAAADALVRRLEEKGPEPLLRARAGLPIPAPQGEQEPHVVPALYQLAERDPAAALERLKALPPFVGLQLDLGTWSLLFCEAARIGSPVERSLAGVGLARPRHLEALRRYVRGEAGAVLPLLPLDLRAAAAFVRSRNAALGAEERAALVAAARSADPLSTHVTQAIARWPGAR